MLSLLGGLMVLGQGQVVPPAVLQAGSLQASLGPEDGRIRLATPGGEVVLEASFLQAEGWAAPEPALEGLKQQAAPEGERLVATFPLAGERQVEVRLFALRELPLVVVTSRLTHLGDLASDYYFWQSNYGLAHYFALETDGLRETVIEDAEWHTLPCRQWYFLPSATGAGGLVLLPTNDFGRSGGEPGNLYLHALPRSALVEPGQYQQASFALGWANDVEEAQRLAEAVRALRLPELEPFGPEAGLPEPVDWGKPAPDWLKEVETTAFFYHPAEDWTPERVASQLSGFPLVIGSTPDAAALARVREGGGKLLHYVTYTCLLDTDLQKAGGREVYSEWFQSLYNEERDLKTHPDWSCIDAEGKVQHDAWGLSFNNPGLLNTCCFQPGLVEAALHQTEGLLELGFDGVFIDLAGATVECHGPEFGAHEHLGPAKTNTQAWEALQQRIYETAKAANPEAIVVQNPVTGLVPSHWAYTDVQLLESFPFGGESTKLTATWPELLWYGAQAQQAAQHGKRVMCLPYFGAFKGDDVRPAAVLSLAWARLFDVIWADASSAGYEFTLEAMPDQQEFYRRLVSARLGKPISGLEVVEGCLIRVFERGFVLLNLMPEAISLNLSSLGINRYVSLTDNSEFLAETGELQLQIAPESALILLQEAG